MDVFRSKRMGETDPLLKSVFSYVLNRSPETARKGSFLGSHNGVVFVPVQIELLLRFNIIAAPNVTGAATGACSGERQAPRGLKLRELARFAVAGACQHSARKGSQRGCRRSPESLHAGRTGPW